MQGALARWWGDALTRCAYRYNLKWDKKIDPKFKYACWSPFSQEHRVRPCESRLGKRGEG